MNIPKAGLILLFVICLPATGLPADGFAGDSKRHGSPADDHRMDAEPQTDGGIRKYAEDAQAGAQKNFGVQPVHDNSAFATFLADRLEYQTREGDSTLIWDVQAWMGSDYNKLWLKSEGGWLTDEEDFEEAQFELFFSRNIGSFWDAQIGVRHDFKPDPDRTFAAIGIQGLAPYWFEVETTAYVSEDGDVSAALEVEYDLLLSQRLILQPRFETSISLQEVEKYGIGRGFNDVETGLRLRYEIRREVAPYIGVSWNKKLGETADLAEGEGENSDVLSFVVGLKLWF